ncbi:MAG: CapA family protein [Myxococcota bacterium]
MRRKPRAEKNIMPKAIRSFFLFLILFLSPSKSVGEEAKDITLIAVGDVTLGYHFEEHLLKEPPRGALPEAVRKYPWKNVGEVMRDADITLVNLECPFTRAKEKVSKNFAFKADPKLVEVLHEGGVDVVTLANNHNMDYKGEGVQETIKTLKEGGIGYFGAGMNIKEARAPAILEVRGKKIGFVGYLHLGNHSIEPEIIWATADSPGMAGHPSNTDMVSAMVKEDIKSLSEKTDIQVVVFHWGRETKNYPLDYQKRLARDAIDSGADAVIAHHPHVLQGIEVYRGVPIFYSLGNFIFGGHWNPGDKKSLIVRLSFGSDNKVKKVELFPVLIDEVPEYPFRPRFAKGKNYDIVKSKVIEFSRGFGDTSLFKSKIPIEWKGD